MLKVVYVVPIIAPYAIPRYQELAKNIDIEVHVIVEKDTSTVRSGWHFQEIDGVTTHLLEGTVSKNYGLNKEKGSYKMKTNRLISFGLKKKIQEIKPDVVLVCNATQIMMLLGKRKYKLGVVVEDTLKSAEGRSTVNSLIKRIMFKSADFYIPFSDDAVEFLKANGMHDPFIRSTWSMDVDFFRDLTKEQIVEKKQQYGMTKKRNYVLTAGLIPRKGILQFLEGWNEMDKKFHAESDLFILGDGVLKEEIGNYITSNSLDNVKLVGNKPYVEVSHYLQCGDIFVLPTLEDLCSLSVLEAMAARKPVLTTIYNGARQFVKEGENGFIFDPLNKNDIISVLKKSEYMDVEVMSSVSGKMVEDYSTAKIMGTLATDLLNICAPK